MADPHREEMTASVKHAYHLSGYHLQDGACMRSIYLLGVVVWMHEPRLRQA